MQLIEDYDLNLDIKQDINESNINRLSDIIAIYTRQALNLLDTPDTQDSPDKLSELKAHCKKWDSVYNLNMKDLYPEFEQCMNLE